MFRLPKRFRRNAAVQKQELSQPFSGIPEHVATFLCCYQPLVGRPVLLIDRTHINQEPSVKVMACLLLNVGVVLERNQDTDILQWHMYFMVKPIFDASTNSDGFVVEHGPGIKVILLP